MHSILDTLPFQQGILTKKDLSIFKYIMFRLIVCDKTLLHIKGSMAEYKSRDHNDHESKSESHLYCYKNSFYCAMVNNKDAIWGSNIKEMHQAKATIWVKINEHCRGNKISWQETSTSHIRYRTTFWATFFVKSASDIPSIIDVYWPINWIWEQKLNNLPICKDWLICIFFFYSLSTLLGLFKAKTYFG